MRGTRVRRPAGFRTFDPRWGHHQTPVGSACSSLCFSFEWHSSQRHHRLPRSKNNCGSPRCGLRWSATSFDVSPSSLPHIWQVNIASTSTSHLIDLHLFRPYHLRQGARCARSWSRVSGAALPMVVGADDRRGLSDVSLVMLPLKTGLAEQAAYCP